ncbi:hypothetical protein ACQ4PT_046981 [Festuca glaucescens]
MRPSRLPPRRSASTLRPLRQGWLQLRQRATSDVVLLRKRAHTYRLPCAQLLCPPPARPPGWLTRAHPRRLPQHLRLHAPANRLHFRLLRLLPCADCASRSCAASTWRTATSVARAPYQSKHHQAAAGSRACMTCHALLPCELLRAQHQRRPTTTSSSSPAAARPHHRPSTPAAPPLTAAGSQLPASPHPGSPATTSGCALRLSSPPASPGAPPLATHTDHAGCAPRPRLPPRRGHLRLARIDLLGVRPPAASAPYRHASNEPGWRQEQMHAPPAAAVPARFASLLPYALRVQLCVLAHAPAAAPASSSLAACLLAGSGARRAAAAPRLRHRRLAPRATPAGFASTGSPPAPAAPTQHQFRQEPLRPVSARHGHVPARRRRALARTVAGCASRATGWFPRDRAWPPATLHGPAPIHIFAGPLPWRAPAAAHAPCLRAPARPRPCHRAVRVAAPIRLPREPSCRLRATPAAPSAPSAGCAAATRPAAASHHASPSTSSANYGGRKKKGSGRAG